MVRGQLRARSSVGMSVRFASERSRVRLPSSPYSRKPLCRSDTAERFSCLQFYETVKIVLADLEPVQRWKITTLQTLKVLEIKVSCGLMPWYTRNGSTPANWCHNRTFFGFVLGNNAMQAWGKGQGRAERAVVLGNRAILHRVVVDYINSAARSAFLIQPAVIYHLD